MELIAIIVICLLAGGYLYIQRQKKINEQHQQETAEKLSAISRHDTLTQMPNRALLEDRINQAILIHGREMTQFAVVSVSLEGLNEIRDKFGVDANTQFLIKWGHELHKNLRKSDTVGRLENDEYLIILNRIKHASDATDIASTLATVLTQDVELEGQNVSIIAKVGVAVYPSAGDNMASLLDSADKYKARAEVRDERDLKTS